MLASVFFAIIALVGSAAGAPTVAANTTIVPCAVTMTHDEFRTAEAYFKANSKSAPEPHPAAVVLNIYFHIISKDNTALGGQIPDNIILQQVGVLNQGFSNAGLSWKIAGVERLVRPDWYRPSVGGPSFQQMKQERYAGGVADLNVYTVGAFTDSTLGYSSFPDQYRNAPRQDGIVIVADTFPGGNIQGNNLGRILTHEAGHWVGLFHTFENFGYYQNGCYGPGDSVDDTPSEASPAFGCPSSRDTCTSPGVDPIHNYMDYTLDSCRTEFTPGQVARLRAQIRTYRGIV